MLVKSYKDVVPYRLQEGEAKGAYVRPLISDEDGAGDMHMNLLRLEPGGQTENDKYSYSQQMFIRKGDGEIIQSSNVRELKEGDVLLIHEEEEFQIRNKTDVDLEILIITPAVDKPPSDLSEESVEEKQDTGEDKEDTEEETQKKEPVSEAAGSADESESGNNNDAENSEGE